MVTAKVIFLVVVMVKDIKLIKATSGDIAL